MESPVKISHTSDLIFEDFPVAKCEFLHCDALIWEITSSHNEICVLSDRSRDTPARWILLQTVEISALKPFVFFKPPCAGAPLSPQFTARRQ